MKEAFLNLRFTADTKLTIERSNEILEEYQAQGFTLTVRQLYYQHVARGYRPNDIKSYKRLVDALTKARLGGYTDWSMLRDDERNASQPYIQPDPKAAFDSIEFAYQEDIWEGQPNYVEVWIEKNALRQVVERPCREHRVTSMACKGYLSVSEMYVAAKRFKHKNLYEKKICHIIHLGDHDPSGIDMTRDNRERIELLSDYSDVTVHRVALNMDQVRRFNPPPNPAKLTDSRSQGYVSQHGRSSWELDALEPRVIQDIVSKKIEELIELPGEMRAMREKTQEGRRVLSWISENAGEVLEYAEERMQEEL